MTDSNTNPERAREDDPQAVVTKMVEDRKRQLKSCERMLVLLQPEWDRFEARDGHDLYVSRDYAEHTSAARTHRKEITALEALLAASERPQMAREMLSDDLGTSTVARQPTVPAGGNTPKRRRKSATIAES